MIWRLDDNDTDLESADKDVQVKSRNSSTDYLDGLRGLAALLVYLSHSSSWWYGNDTTYEHGFGYHGEHMFASLPFLRILFTGGGSAVALFFVLSGYVLSVTPLRLLRKSDKVELRKYLLTASIRRPFRLYLPVAAVSLVMVAIMQIPFGYAPHLEWPKSRPNLFAELWNLLRELSWRLNFFVEHTNETPWFPYDPPVWTMPAEFGGSLYLFALLAAGGMVSAAQRLVIVVSCGVLLLSIGQWTYAAFSFGAVMAMLDGEQVASRAAPTRPSNALNHLILFAGWYLLGQPIGKNPELSWATPGWFTLTVLTPPAYRARKFGRFWPLIGATMVVYAVTKLAWIQRLFRRKVFVYLGKVSFALYLVHVPLLWIVGDRLARAFGKYRFSFPTPFDDLMLISDFGCVGLSTGFLSWQSIILPICLWLSAIVTQKIDGPSIRFSKRIALRMQRFVY